MVWRWLEPDVRQRHRQSKKEYMRKPEAKEKWWKTRSLWYRRINTQANDYEVLTNSLNTIFSYVFKAQPEQRAKEVYQELLEGYARDPPEYREAFERILAILPVEETEPRTGIYRMKTSQ
ncbi:hypothetical protein ES703_101252 [subsurface metagenome]